MKLILKALIRKLYSKIFKFFLFDSGVGENLEQLRNEIEIFKRQISDLNLTTEGFYRQSMIEIFAFLKPSIINDLQPSRIGKEGDGSYYLLPDFSDQDCVFSIGIGDEISFDNQLVHSVGRIIMIDHSIPEFIPQHSSMTMLHKKLSLIQNDQEINFSQLFGSYPSKDYILKMDIEGDEWDILNSIDSKDLARFRQIVIEFHGLTKLKSSSLRLEVLKILKKIYYTHAVFFLHANNNGDFRVFGDLLIPDIIEVSFARRSDYKICDHLSSFESMNIPQNSKIRDPIEIEWLESIFLK